MGWVERTAAGSLEESSGDRSQSSKTLHSPRERPLSAAQPRSLHAQPPYSPSPAGRMSCDSQSPCTERVREGEGSYTRTSTESLHPHTLTLPPSPSHPHIYLNDVQDVHVEVLHREGIALGHANHELIAILKQQVLLCLELTLTLKEN